MRKSPKANMEAPLMWFRETSKGAWGMCSHGCLLRATLRDRSQGFSRCGRVANEAIAPFLK